MTQADRLLRYLYDHPGASHMEIGGALYIANVNARISDLRAAGHAIEARRDRDGVYRYSVLLRPVQLTVDGREEALAV